MRYNKNPRFQYTEREMQRMVLAMTPRLMRNRARHGRCLDILITHAPPAGIHDGADLCHRGFAAFLLFMRWFQPRYLVHGHKHVYRSDEAYRDSGYLNIAPDLIIGFARGVRGSDESALGQLSPHVMSDNTSKWSGDHMADREIIPGILLTNRPLQRNVTSLTDLAAAVLAEFGVEGFPPRE